MAEIAPAAQHIQPQPEFSLARQVAWFVAMLVVCFGASGLGAEMTFSSLGDWYPTLAKPAWTPPDGVFGPVWTLLYFLMALAAWIVWRRGGWSAERLPLGIFALQLGLNVGWSACFFGLRNPGLAAAEIVLLWLAILTTVITFWRRAPLAGGLMLPYLGWTTFAAALNFAIWRLNA